MMSYMGESEKDTNPNKMQKDNSRGNQGPLVGALLGTISHMKEGRQEGPRAHGRNITGNNMSLCLEVHELYPEQQEGNGHLHDKVSLNLLGGCCEKECRQEGCRAHGRSITGHNVLLCMEEHELYPEMHEEQDSHLTILEGAHDWSRAEVTVPRSDKKIEELETNVHDKLRNPRASGTRRARHETSPRRWQRRDWWLRLPGCLATGSVPLPLLPPSSPHPPSLSGSLYRPSSLPPYPSTPLHSIPPLTPTSPTALLVCQVASAKSAGRYTPGSPLYETAQINKYPVIPPAQHHSLRMTQTTLRERDRCLSADSAEQRDVTLEVAKQNNKFCDNGTRREKREGRQSIRRSPGSVLKTTASRLSPPGGESGFDRMLAEVPGVARSLRKVNRQILEGMGDNFLEM
ncbi:hypothetical protein AAG570_001066 [Ranatra chinensis]|uniref:Uncharacterized protein n=1 Tax=Ranatra chinensis TaxID=642074 RepID=A0ABD0YTC6_9HEMI